jgi:hypothetical protein
MYDTDSYEGWIEFYVLFEDTDYFKRLMAIYFYLEALLKSSK